LESDGCLGDAASKDYSKETSVAAKADKQHPQRDGFLPTRTLHPFHLFIRLPFPGGGGQLAGDDFDSSTSHLD
jgi:hypothetical protein